MDSCYYCGVRFWQSYSLGGSDTHVNTSYIGITTLQGEMLGNKGFVVYKKVVRRSLCLRFMSYFGDAK